MIPNPNQLGLPSKFTSWRENQSEAVETAITTNKRFIAQVCPTGFGKSLAYMGIGRFIGRTVVLTSSKGLQNQIMKDFGNGEMDSIADVRGRNAYICRQSNGRTTCDQAACINGFECSIKNYGCDYFNAVRKAKKASIVITNYAYWMTCNKYGEGLGNFDLIVCDEAHELPDLVSSFLTIELSRYEDMLKNRLEGFETWDINTWRNWAHDVVEEVEEYVTELKGNTSKTAIKRVVKLKKLIGELKRLVKVDDWVIDIDKYSIRFCPIWPKEYTEGVLFLGIKKVVLTSATIRLKTLELLGIESDSVELIEYPHSFPLENRLLIHIPTIRLNFRTTPEELKRWLMRIKQITKKNINTKGIIHPVSYKRCQYVKEGLSEMGVELMTHSSKNTEAKVRQYKESDSNCVLISPSVTTGYDFPGDECRWQILGKVPYPDTQSKLMKSRNKEDKDYSSYVAMQQLVQTCGRGVRSKDDYCKSYIIDDNITWFFYRYREFAPTWFHECLVSRGVI